MILVDGVPLLASSSSPSSQGDELLAALLEHPSLIAASNALKSKPEMKVPEGIGSQKHIYVFQREYATVDPSLVQVVGTDEATTCVGIAIRNRDTGMTSVAHVDSPKVVESGLAQMLALVIENGNGASLDVHLIGGYNDAADEDIFDNSGFNGHSKCVGHSLPLCSKIITALQSCRENFHIQTFCVLGHNTRKNSEGYACPVVGGFMVETSCGSIMPAQFNISSRCPDEIVRRIRVIVSSEDPNWWGKLLETYDTKHDRFEIAPCCWSSNWAIYARNLLQLSDSETLLQCSTSPFAEPPDFVNTLRREFSYLMSYPDWRRTFSKKKPRVFERTTDGGWSRCN